MIYECYWLVTYDPKPNPLVTGIIRFAYDPVVEALQIKLLLNSSPPTGGSSLSHCR